MFLRKSLFGVMGTILACGVMAFAQEPQPQPSVQDGNLSQDKVERMERRRQRMSQREGFRDQRRMGRSGGMGRMMRDLNLTEAQREQSRAIIQRRLEGTKSQREELFRLREKRIAGTFTAEDEARTKTLHQEIRTSMQGVREEMTGILTAEQKGKLEEQQQERKLRMEQRMKEREQRRQERLNNKPQSL